MKDFVAIDFETANPQRVSACAFGFAEVIDGAVVSSGSYFIKPVGGHAPFQSKIHGILEEHTFDKPEFGELFPTVQSYFERPLVAHSKFDQQVLRALASHYDLMVEANFTDSCEVAKQRLPELKSYRLDALVKHFGLPRFEHHDAKEDAVACANVFLRLNQHAEPSASVPHDESCCTAFEIMLSDILADSVVDYKEAYSLFYWLEDHPEERKQHGYLYAKLRETLWDEKLDATEAKQLKRYLLDMVGGR